MERLGRDGCRARGVRMRSAVVRSGLLLAVLLGLSCESSEGEGSATQGVGNTPPGASPGAMMAPPSTQTMPGAPAPGASPSGPSMTPGGSGPSAPGQPMMGSMSTLPTGSMAGMGGAPLMPVTNPMSSMDPPAGPMHPPASSGACTRELLAATIDTYFASLAAHDPSMLPTSPDVKFTENGELLELGEGLWANAGMLVYKHSALDTEKCMSVTQAVVPDGGTDIPLGLRLALEGTMITEIETIAVRQGDYFLPSNTADIAASATRIMWDQTVPEAERFSRQEIDDWVTNYFVRFNRAGCNLAESCERRENGGGTFRCADALTCSEGTTSMALDARLTVVDVERGIGVGFTMFEFGGRNYGTDFHMVKMYSGEVYAVHAYLAAADSSGWD